MKRVSKVLAIVLTLGLGVLVTGCGKSAASTLTADVKEEVNQEIKEETEIVTIKVATGGSPRPYVYVGEDNEPTGYDIEVLKAVFEKLPNYELQIEVTDFGSVFSGLTSGIYKIGVNNFSYKEERGKSYLYSYPYDKIGYVFVTKKGTEPIESFEQAAGKNFEGSAGVSVTTAVEAWNELNPDKAINISYSEADTALLLQHIEDGRVDLGIIDVAMYKSYLEEFDYDVQFVNVPEEEAKLIADNSYAYFILPKDQVELRDEVNLALKVLKQDGTLTQLSQKWFGQDTAPEDDRFEETIN